MCILCGIPFADVLSFADSLATSQVTKTQHGHPTKNIENFLKIRVFWTFFADNNLSLFYILRICLFDLELWRLCCWNWIYLFWILTSHVSWCYFYISFLFQVNEVNPERKLSLCDFIRCCSICKRLRRKWINRSLLYSEDQLIFGRISQARTENEI